MKLPAVQQAVHQVLERLAEFHGQALSEAEIRLELLPEADAVIQLGGSTFVVEWKGTGKLAEVATAARQARQMAAELGQSVFPLVAVPFMGPVGRAHCEKDHTPWLDLSGNARIEIPGLRVRIEGRPNRFKRRGRPSSAFAPKSSRIARWLLIHPNQAMSQREIAKATDMDEGFTSRIVSRLVEDELVTREKDGAICAGDPDLLLDSWREEYDFSKHEVIRGHAPARSGHELLRRVAASLGKRGYRYAATGLAAAWMMSRFAGFRIATFYIPEHLPSGPLEALGFRQGEDGANVWLVIPNDEGVFQGTCEIETIRCVHPVQAYLDLKHHPERASEAADQIRGEHLRWSTDA